MEALCNESSDELIALCQTLLSRETNAPVGTPFQLSTELFCSIRKVYINTSLDNTITYGLQKEMVLRLPWIRLSK